MATPTGWSETTLRPVRASPAGFAAAINSAGLHPCGAPPTMSHNAIRGRYPGITQSGRRPSRADPLPEEMGPPLGRQCLPPPGQVEQGPLILGLQGSERRSPPRSLRHGPPPPSWCEGTCGRCSRSRPWRRGHLERSCRVSDQNGFQPDLEHPPADLDEGRLCIHDGVSIADGSGRGADFPLTLGGEIVRQAAPITRRRCPYSPRAALRLPGTLHHDLRKSSLDTGSNPPRDSKTFG